MVNLQQPAQADKLTRLPLRYKYGGQVKYSKKNTSYKKKAIKNYNPKDPLEKSDSIICEPACHIKFYVTGRSVANLTRHWRAEYLRNNNIKDRL
ncbi:MAG: hypothetical protein KJ666_08690 [Bacteroidetes bacterium]|nr:hypothetical protein [Bacteroidota bacterium]